MSWRAYCIQDKADRLATLGEVILANGHTTGNEHTLATLIAEYRAEVKQLDDMEKAEAAKS